MKINWGTGIFLFYSFFAITLFYQVYKSTQYDHSLVVEDYYAKDLTYQSTLDKLENSLALKTRVKINHLQSLKRVEIDFPKNFKSIKGNVLFYRASNKKKDANLPIRVNENNQMGIAIDQLDFGQWKLEVDWEANGKSYLDRKTIDISDASLGSIN